MMTLLTEDDFHMFCLISEHKRHTEDKRAHTSSWLLQTAWCTRLMQTEIREHTVTHSEKQTRQDSEVSRTSTARQRRNTSRRWLNTYCFVGNSNTLLTGTVRLPLIDALTEAALSFSASPIVTVLFYGVAPPPPPHFLISLSSSTPSLFFLPVFHPAMASPLPPNHILLLFFSSTRWHTVCSTMAAGVTWNEFSLLVRQQVIEFLRCQTDLIRRSSSLSCHCFHRFGGFFLAVLKYHPI